MKKLIVVGLLILSIISTLIVNLEVNEAVVKEGDYYLVKSDFHVHSFFGDGGSSPLAVVYQAKQKGLNCFALTNHNQLITAKIAHWWSSIINGPIVFVGSEITSPNYHIIGVGLTQTVNWRQPAVSIIADVHSQGGIAIAAHPDHSFSKDYTEEALVSLDGSEVFHSLYYDLPDLYPQLIEFYQKTKLHNPRLAPIASSDWHVFDGLGYYKTIIISPSLSKENLLRAIREGKTVVYTPDGKYYGQSEMIKLIKKNAGELFEVARPSELVNVLSGLLLIGSFLLYGVNLTKL